MVENKDNAIKDLPIRLLTKQVQYAIPDNPLYVPATININEINNLINGLIKESNDLHEAVEFDCLVQSEFLRVPLLEHIEEKGISVENVIEIEYFVQHPPPEPQNYILHDDWVSAVAVRDNWILTGCYDNTLHIYTAKGKHHLTISGHTKPITDVAWISLDKERATFVSTSQDQTAIIWSWNIPNNAAKTLYVCKGHERSIESVCVNYNNTLMVTGSYDTLLKLWSTSTNDDNDEDGVSKPKKTKRDVNNIKVPKRTLKGHKESISAVVWTDKSEVVTSSMDHTLKLWDIELGGIKHEIIGNKSFFDVDYSHLNKALITASADWHVRLYDPRSTDAIVKGTYTAHKQWVKCVKWSTTNEYLFISGAYDNVLKLWDTRTTKTSLYDLTGHEDKILCCDWSNPNLMVSGSADNTVRTYKSKYVTCQ